ncbi:MAG: ATP-binding protein [Alphaproteobacteria bacterium]|nr:ATP-binding protein [Alphaproteobacteria bacterium]MCB1840640.1 ATP-binding protein [Alphaproteobacteria bacterium]
MNKAQKKIKPEGMKVTDVFTPSKFPEHTLIDDHLTSKKVQLQDALEEGTTLISISGPSKSGKTVFVEDCLGKDNLIQITGAGTSSPESLWNKVFAMLGTPVDSEFSHGAKNQSGVKVEGEGGLSVALAKGSAKVSFSEDKTKEILSKSKQTTDFLNLLIRELSETDFIIFIDDFHYIEKSVQSEIARQIKEAIRNKVKIICASVPYHSDDVLRGNPDLRGRICSIDFDYWDSPTLQKIAYKGFDLLNIECDKNIIENFAAEAAGSPQLMQNLCLMFCREVEVRSAQPNRMSFVFDEKNFDGACKRTVVSADYSSVVSKVLDGPKTRGSDRKLYKTRFGWEGDVYKLLLKAFASNPPTLNFRYQELTDRVASIVEKDATAPSGSSVTGACQHAASIANSSAGNSIVEWDSDNDVFDIRDPYFLFYLRWAEVLDR